jgi:hypothetical protein
MMFSVWFMLRCYKQGTELVESEKSSAQEAVKIAQESPLLEAIAKEWLVKTQQAGKDLAGAVVICGD